MKINDVIYHPFSLDIVSFKITGIRVYEDSKIVEATSTAPIGACGIVKILLYSVDNKETLTFLEFNKNWYHKHQSGLGDFVEGEYFFNKDKARLEFYNMQLSIAMTNASNKEKLFKEAKAREEQIKLIITKIKEKLNGQNNTTNH